jgi:hypothetical protein
MKREDIDYGELQQFLRNLKSMRDDDVYDFVGMLQLFRACLLNLMEYSIEADWPIAAEAMDAAERDFLTKIARAKAHVDDGSST